MRNLLTSLVLLFIFTVAIFFGGAVFKVFGTLDGPGVIEGKVLPEKALQDRASRINVVKSELEVLDEKSLFISNEILKEIDAHKGNQKFHKNII